MGNTKLHSGDRMHDLFITVRSKRNKKCMKRKMVINKGTKRNKRYVTTNTVFPLSTITSFKTQTNNRFHALQDLHESLTDNSDTTLNPTDAQHKKDLNNANSKSYTPNLKRQKRWPIKHKGPTRYKAHGGTISPKNWAQGGISNNHRKCAQGGSTNWHSYECSTKCRCQHKIAGIHTANCISKTSINANRCTDRATMQCKCANGVLGTHETTCNAAPIVTMPNKKDYLKNENKFTLAFCNAQSVKNKTNVITDYRRSSMIDVFP